MRERRQSAIFFRAIEKFIFLCYNTDSILIKGLNLYERYRKVLLPHLRLHDGDMRAILPMRRPLFRGRYISELRKIFSDSRIRSGYQHSRAHILHFPPE